MLHWKPSPFRMEGQATSGGAERATVAGEATFGGDLARTVVVIEAVAT